MKRALVRLFTRHSALNMILSGGVAFMAVIYARTDWRPARPILFITCVAMASLYAFQQIKFDWDLEKGRQERQARRQADYAKMRAEGVDERKIRYLAEIFDEPHPLGLFGKLLRPAVERHIRNAR